MPFLGIARYPVKFAIVTAFCIPLLTAFAWKEESGAGPNRKALLAAAGTLLLGISFMLWFSKTYPFPYEQWPVVLKNGIGRALFLISATALLLALEALKSQPWAAAQTSGFLLGSCLITRKTLLQGCLLALIIGDVCTHMIEQNPVAPVSAMSPGIWREINTAPAPKPGGGRVMISPKAESMLTSSAQRGATADFMAKRRALWSNLNILEGIPKVNGSSTLQIKEQKKVEELLYKQTNGMPVGLLSFLGVAQYTSREFAIDFEPRTNSCPWIAIGQAPLFLSPEETLHAVFSPGFDPRKTVYLPSELRGAVRASGDQNATICSQSFSAEKAVVELEADAPILIVIAQSYHRGWKAFVDGKAVPVWRANYAFQAVEAPTGRHRVEFKYEEPWLMAGGLVSGLTTVLCAVLWLFTARRRKYSETIASDACSNQASALGCAALPH
jgi:hypothetical protein